MSQCKHTHTGQLQHLEQCRRIKEQIIINLVNYNLRKPSDTQCRYRTCKHSYNTHTSFSKLMVRVFTYSFNDGSISASLLRQRNFNISSLHTQNAEHVVHKPHTHTTILTGTKTHQVETPNFVLSDKTKDQSKAKIRALNMHY